MITTLKNFGDGLEIQFPDSLLEKVSIFENEDVEVVILDKRIVIKNIGYLCPKL